MASQRTRRTNKRDKRQQRSGGIAANVNVVPPKFGFTHAIKPITGNQEYAFESWNQGFNLMLHGIAGTGKTYLGLYFSLSEVMKRNSPHKKVYIIRSTVPTRDQGFMPGTQKQKEAVYEEAYVEVANELMGRGDAYQILKQRGLIEFRSTSFLRGLTLSNCIIVVDEVQNMSDGELHTIMTRVGTDCKIIFCGDVKQDDLTNERKKEVSGLRKFMRVIDTMEEFDFIEFFAEDIVRSDLVRSYIIARDRLGL